ncbi:aspartate/glutamate racemase family protein [Legionella tunisiensis]|uniref:aspartate/glutamate racemase family protein n=1 Tax=Legionella tunisiensis TaxID=1034944 RepID=UPI0002E69FB6|nr:aspartate/glutamate racemase family protein [Legionella tunisiensis]
MTQVHVILPGYNTKVLNKEMLQPYQSSELQLSIRYVDIEVDAMRHEFDMALIAPGLIYEALAAEKEKADAIVIDMMADSALRALRESVSIPVVSLPQTTMHVAAMMGNKFAIINTTEELTPIQENLARVYGLYDRLACIQGVQLDPKDDYRSEATISALVEHCYDAVTSKRADVLIFGSGRLIAYRDVISERLNRKGINVPIIEPLPTGIYFAKFLADAGIAQSKRVYNSPAENSLKIYAKILASYTK